MFRLSCIDIFISLNKFEPMTGHLEKKYDYINVTLIMLIQSVEHMQNAVFVL